MKLITFLIFAIALLQFGWAQELTSHHQQHVDVESVKNSETPPLPLPLPVLISSSGQDKIVRQSEDEEEEGESAGTPNRSPSIIRVAADVLLAAVGNRSDSLFNLTHQVQNVAKFITRPGESIGNLVNNFGKFIGLAKRINGSTSTSGVVVAEEIIEGEAGEPLVVVAAAGNGTEKEEEVGPPVGSSSAKVNVVGI